MSINKVGEKFNLEKLISAQQLTKEVVRKVASLMKVGMSEQDGIDLLNQEFKKYGEIKFWHPHKFRIGKNTLCAFKEESDPSVRLKADDIFFIDVGPIFFDHEGDYGETFIVGENERATSLKLVSEKLFLDCQQRFLKENISGKALYEFLHIKSNEYGVKLNMKTLGHRIGDFPHQLFYRGKMADVEENISPNVWVLEVQIENREGDMGAFFEDILIEK